MGAVYLVFDREFCRELALKRIHPQGVGQEDHEERFRREYRAPWRGVGVKSCLKQQAAHRARLAA